MKAKIIVLQLACLLSIGLLSGCNRTSTEAVPPAAELESPASDDNGIRTIADGRDRQVEIPETVESIVCVGVGALRYTCYTGGQELVAGVEDYETKPGMSRLYNYVNFDKFESLPIIGTNDEPFVEEIISVNPQVIVMSSYAKVDPDELQNRTRIPVVVVPGSDKALDDGAYTTIRIMGELYGTEERAKELTEYLHGIEADLAARTEGIADEEKPSVYVGGVSFKGNHGFEGTEAHYSPLELTGAKNLADSTGQTGAFDVDMEQVLEWDPDVILLDFNGMDLINKDYETNADYYNSLSAVQKGNVYSQISFRSNAVNLETALADTYYAASILYPEQFSDIDIEEKTGEIFQTLLGSNPYNDLKEAGYEFRKIQIGQ